MKPTLDELIKEIADREAKATPGPWIQTMEGHYQSRVCELDTTNIHARDSIKVDIEDTEWNADFIAHARTDIPKLLAVIAKLREQRNNRTDSIWTDELDAELAEILEGKK